MTNTPSPRPVQPYHIRTKSGASPIEAGYGLVHADTIIATTDDELHITPAGARFELKVDGKTTGGPLAALGLGAGWHSGLLRVWQGSATLADKAVKLLLVEPKRLCRRFGARYGALEYDLPVAVHLNPASGALVKTPWPSLWKTGAVADIVVDFEAPYKMVLWRGMAYTPSWALDNVMTSNFFAETVEPKVFRDCCEMMSDRECRYSHARVIHSSDARVVIHWRYALNDSAYAICRNQWADEMLYIYPDGVAVRNVTVYLDPGDATAWCTSPRTGERVPVPMMKGGGGKRSFNDMEFITVNPAGASAEDVAPLDAFTLLDGLAFARTYRWPQPPDFTREPIPELSEYIFRMNYRHRPGVFIASPGADINLRLQAGTSGIRYVPGERVEEDRWETVCDSPADFVTCVHWPVTRAYGTRSLSDPAQYQDGPTHSFLGYAENAPVEVRADGACTWSWLCGMAPEDDGVLRRRVTAWTNPAPISGAIYRQRQAAYEVQDAQELIVGAERPVIHPTFLLNCVKALPVRVKVNGQIMDQARVAVGAERDLAGDRAAVTLKTDLPPNASIRFV